MTNGTSLNWAGITAGEVGEAAALPENAIGPAVAQCGLANASAGRKRIDARLIAKVRMAYSF
jgi:hypothetical protein